MIKWLQKLAVEKRGRQIKIQDKMVDLEQTVQQTHKDMQVASAVLELMAKELMLVKAILNKAGLNDTVISLSPEQAEKLIMKVVPNEQH